MYFALNQNIDSFDTYCSFLTEIIETGNTYYIKIFNEIITEAKELASTKNYYAVTSERFEIISILASNTVLIDSLQIENLQNQDFKRILAFLNEENCVEV